MGGVRGMETRISGVACGAQGVVGLVEASRGVATPSPVPSQTTGVTITPVATLTSALSRDLAATATTGQLTSGSMTQSPAGAVLVTPPASQQSHQHQTSAGLPRILSRNVNGTRESFIPVSLS